MVNACSGISTSQQSQKDTILNIMGLGLAKMVGMNDISKMKEVESSAIDEMNDGFINNRTKDMIPKIYRSTKLESVNLNPIISNNQTIADGTPAIMFLQMEENNIQPIIGNQILPKCFKTRY